MERIERRLEIAYLFDWYGALLTQKQQEVIDLYYHKDFSLAEIAQAAAISRQAVHDLLQRSVRLLEHYEERLQFVRRYRDRQRELSSIRTDLEKLRLHVENEATLSRQTMLQDIDRILDRVKILEE